MIKPILACENPYEMAKQFESVGWKIDFIQPPESNDPLAGVSLIDNSLLLGITNGYVLSKHTPYIGCGVEIYMTVPKEKIKEIYDNHRTLSPSNLEIQPWGDYAFEVMIGNFKFMIATK